MSAIVTGLVWAANLPREEKFILLAYADHADHEGNGIFPSVPLISWKTGYSDRQIQRVVGELLKRGIMIHHGESRLGTEQYSIDLDALPAREPYKSQRRGRPAGVVKQEENELESAQNQSNNGDKMTPLFPENGAILAENGDILAENGDIAMSPKPSVNRQLKPSLINPENSKSDDNEEKKSTGKREKKSSLTRDQINQIAHALAIATGLDFEKNQKQLFAEAKNYKPEELRRIQVEYTGKSALWYKTDWRGQLGQKPTLKMIRETWGNLSLAEGAKKPASRGGSSNYKPHAAQDPSVTEQILKETGGMNANR